MSKKNQTDAPEEELKKLRERVKRLECEKDIYRHFFYHCIDLTFILDHEFNIILSNNALPNFFDYQESKHRNTNFFNFLASNLDKILLQELKNKFELFNNEKLSKDYVLSTKISIPQDNKTEEWINIRAYKKQIEHELLETPDCIFVQINNVTEAHLVEESILDSERKYRLLFENMLNGCVIFEQIEDKGNGKTTYKLREFNDAFVKLSGFDKKEFKEKVLSKEPGDGKNEKKEILFKDVFEQNKPQRIETYDALFDKHLEAFVFSPQENHVAAVINDITDKEIFKRNLEEQNIFIRKITETVPYIISIHNVSSRVNYWVNQHIKELLGFSISEWLNLSLKRLLSMIQNEDVISMTNLPEELGKSDNEGFIERELRIKHKNGTMRWIFCRFVVFECGQNGEIEQILCIAKGIDEEKHIRKELNEQYIFYEQISNALPALLFILQLKPFGCTWVNQGSVNLLGTEKQTFSELKEKSFYELFHPDEQSIVREYIQSLNQTNNDDDEIYESELRIRHKNGYWIWFNVRAIPFKLDVTGNVSEILFTCKDIADRKTDELRLRQQYEKIQYQNNELDRVNKELSKVNRSLIETSSKLIGSEEKLRSLLNYSSDIITVINSEGIITFMSPGIKKATGISPKKYLDTSYLDIIIPADNERVKNILFKNSGVEGRIANLQYRGKRKDGSFIYLESVFNYQFKNPAINGIIVNSRDVSDRVYMENELRKEIRFREKISRMMPILVYIYDIERDNIIWVNKKQPKSVGIPNYIPFSANIEEFFKILHPQEKSHLEATINRLKNIRDEEVIDLEYKIMTIDDNWSWIHTKIMGLKKDESGHFSQFLGMTEEVSKRKNIEEAYKEHVLKLNTVIQTVGEGLALVDEQGRFEIFNLKMYQITGYSKTETQNYYTFISNILPDNDKVKYYAESSDIKSLTNMLHHTEQTITTKSGGKKSILITSTAFNFHNNNYYLSVYRDITRIRKAEAILRETEKRYRIIAEHTTDAIWMFDTNLRLTYVSPSIEDLTGYKAEERYKLSLKERYSPESIREIKKVYNSFLEKYKKGEHTDVVYPAFEIEYYHKNGSKVIGEIRPTPLFDENGIFTGILGITRDVTKRKKMEETLRQSEQQLRELNTTKDKFFSIISHGLINPFNSLIGFSELLINKFHEFGEQEKYEFIKRMNQSSRQGYFLLQNLLQWSRSQIGGIKAKKENIDIYDIVFNTMKVFKDSAELKHVKLENSVSKNIIAVADQNMVQTILINLLSNAIKYSKKGSCVRIESEIKDDLVHLHVVDEGAGIDESNIHKLFRLDIHFSTRGTSNERGSGLGLLLCKEFMDKIGGQIWVNSEKGKGSRFSISLKLYEAP